MNLLIADLGMDLATTGIDGVSNITSFGLFPNPATDGRFNISFEAAHPVGETTITVSSVTGQLVLRQVYSAAGASFFKEIVLQDVAKGTYMVEVTGGNDHIVRQLVVQ